MGKWLGNGQCYAVPAEYSGFMGGCGLGAGTIYGFSHVIGDTSSLQILVKHMIGMR